ncbi:hypothetical protein LXL04_006992 [Taraxacum kok-saghyz]
MREALFFCMSSQKYLRRLIFYVIPSSKTFHPLTSLQFAPHLETLNHCSTILKAATNSFYSIDQDLLQPLHHHTNRDRLFQTQIAHRRNISPHLGADPQIGISFPVDCMPPIRAINLSGSPSMSTPVSPNYRLVAELLWLELVWIVDWWAGVKVYLYTDSETLEMMDKLDIDLSGCDITQVAYVRDSYTHLST